MPTVFTHALAGAVLGQILAPASYVRGLTCIAAATAMLPDADVIGLRLGIPYSDMLGHRGLTHSLVFACAVALAAVVPFWPRARPWERIQIVLCIAVATASHGILDAFTNGGRGVAFFAPFNANRYFFPVTPIEVAPLNARALLTERGLSVLLSELLWIWCPALLIVAVVTVVRSRRASA